MQPQDSYSGNLLTINFILEFVEWKDQICFTKDEHLLLNWERPYARTTLKESFVVVVQNEALKSK